MFREANVRLAIRSSRAQSDTMGVLSSRAKSQGQRKPGKTGLMPCNHTEKLCGEGFGRFCIGVSSEKMPF